MSTQAWFQGTINEAVQLVNTKNCVFVVFIHDDTEPSNQLGENLNDTKLQDTLQKHVSLKLNQDSENARLFGQFYPIQRVPIVYFIKQGVIKDFAIETTSVQEIVDKVNRLGQTDVIPSTTSSSALSPPSITTETSSPPMDPVPDLTSSATIVNTDPNTSQTTDSSTPAADLDKKQKLKQQMEQARARRDEIEKENEKQREIKRRQDGKEAQLTQQQIQDQQNKVYFAKIKKEKQADEEHRRKIKEQIARDREEKMAERQRRLQQQQDTTQPSSSPQHLRQNKDIRQHDVCHLNVRQGDGNNIKNTFNAQDKLEDVRTWIDENRTDGDQPYKLLAQFPTRHFSTGDEQKTLHSLDLVPSSTIIMKPIRNVASAYQSPSGAAASYGGMMADYVYSAGGIVYNTLTGVAGALGNMMGAVGPAVGTDGHRLGGPQTQSASSGSRQIHTLQQEDQADDDDRKKTYNGNSVNQE